MGHRGAACCHTYISLRLVRKARACITGVSGPAGSQAAGSRARCVRPPGRASRTRPDRAAAAQRRRRWWRRRGCRGRRGGHCGLAAADLVHQGPCTRAAVHVRAGGAVALQRQPSPLGV